MEISSGDETAEEPGYRADTFCRTAPFKLSYLPTYINSFTSPGLQGLRPIRAQKKVGVIAAGHLRRTSRPSGHGRIPQTLPPHSAHTPQRRKHSSARRAPPRGPTPSSWNSREAGEDYSRETRLHRGGRQRVPSRLCARLQVPSCSSGGCAAPRGKAAVCHTTHAHSFFNSPPCASGIFGALQSDKQGYGSWLAMTSEEV